MNLPFKLVKIEAVANVATIVVAGLLSVVLVKEYLLPTSPSSRNPAAVAAVEPAAVGTNLKDQLPGVDWSRNGRTLVLAISTHCHFCTESAPFFGRLKEEAGRSVKIVALMPEPVGEGASYLKAKGVSVDQIKQ